jgi:class 3 adenylate cyclase
MDVAQTRYLDREGAALAYQVFGSGDAGVVVAYEIGGHLDLIWTDPYMHAQYERIASRCRIAVFQPRGVGMSEPIGYVPTIEQQADDVIAVMNAASLDRVTLAASMTTCAVAALVAARNPDRVRNLCLIQPFGTGPLAEQSEEAGWPTAGRDRLVAEIRAIAEHWGSGKSTEFLESAGASSYNRRLFGMLERCSAAPSTAQRYMEWVLQMSFLEVFRAVPVPTTVLYLPAALAPLEVAQAVADVVPGADLIEFSESAPGATVGEAWQPIWDRVISMATGAELAPDIGRFLGAVLFTDVVDSTRMLAEMGDARYRELRDAHERQVRMHVEGNDGRLVNVSGDGTFSVFDGPSRAVQAAQAICAEAAELGIRVRGGVHSGELERTAGHDITGLTVHVGARVAGAAEAGQVLVSRTVRDLALGSGLRFEPRGEHELKGVPGTWELFSVRDQPQPTAPEAQAPTPTVVDRAALRVAQRAPRLARGAVAAGAAWQRRRARTS